MEEKTNQEIETIQIIEVDEVEVVDVEIDGAFPSLGEPNEQLNHALLNNREIPDQHPITAISGLRRELDDINSLQVVYSDKKQQADYYLWHDENPLGQNRQGLFVSIYQKVEHDALHNSTCCIEICDGTCDVFGVVVAEAGFVGGNTYLEVENQYENDAICVHKERLANNHKYGLIVHSGLVAVCCDINVEVGNYVVPKSNGQAQKSKGNYGYLVTSLSEINGVRHAIISLNASSTLAKQTADVVEDLTERVSASEHNIVSATNVANSAYSLALDAKENANVSSEYIKEKVEEVLGKMDEADGIIGNLSESVNNAWANAALAKAMAEDAVNSAQEIGGKAIVDANKALEEVYKTKQEVEKSIDDINTELDTTAIAIQETKEDIVANKNELQNNINKTISDIETLEEDLKPLATWSDGKGVAGFVARADADSATLGSIVSLEGDFGKSLAGFVTEAAKDNATVAAIANYQQKDANGNPTGNSGASALMGQVDANTASINLLTELQGEGFAGLAGLMAQVNQNKSSVETIASHVVGDFIYIDDWTLDNKDPSKVYYAKNNSQYYYWDQEWIHTDKPYKAGLSGAISGIQNVADDNSATLNTLTEWQSEAIESIAGVTQTASENAADISLIAEWKSGVEGDVSSIASIKSTADANKASIEQLVKKDSELSETIAGVKTTADENKAEIQGITSWKSTVDPTINSVASIKQTADSNKSRIDQLVSWQGDTNTAMASLKQHADKDGAYLQSFVSNVHKYSYGPYSQANRFTYEEALNILEVGAIYVPSVKHTETYAKTEKYDAISIEFELGYYYTWKIDPKDSKLKWMPSSSVAVMSLSQYVVGTDTIQYWVATADITHDGVTYEKDCLYKWDAVHTVDGVEYKSWVKVASLQSNLGTVTTSLIKQTSNSIEMAVSDINNNYSGTKSWVDSNKAAIQDMVSWHGENGDSLVTFMQEAGDNFASASQVAKIVDKDGNIKEASIVTAVNNNASSIYLSADNINFEAENYTIKADKIKFEGSQFSITVTNSINDAKDEAIAATEDALKGYSTKDETNKAKAEAISSANNTMDTKLKNYSTTTETQNAIDKKAESIADTVSQTYSTKGEIEVAKKQAIAAASNNTTQQLTNYSTKDDTKTAKTEAISEANSNTKETLKDYSTTKKTQDYIDAAKKEAIDDADKKLSETKTDLQTKIAQTAESISLVVTEKNGQKVVNSASISAAIADDESSIKMIADKIDIDGYVTFTHLETEGATTIHGGNIQTNSLSAISAHLGDIESGCIHSRNYKKVITKWE